MVENKKYVAVIWNANYSIDRLGIVIDKVTFMQEANPNVKADLEKIIGEEVILMKLLNADTCVFEKRQQVGRSLIIGSLDYVTDQLKSKQWYIKQENERYNKVLALLEKEKPSKLSEAYLTLSKYTNIFRGIF